MPSVPIEMPSDTVIVLKMTAFPPARIGARGRLPRQLVDVHVARRDLTPGRADPDLRLREVFPRESNRMQHRAPRRARRSVEHLRGMRTFVDHDAGIRSLAQRSVQPSETRRKRR